MNLFQKITWEVKRRFANLVNATLERNPGGINLYVNRNKLFWGKGWYHAASAEEAYDILKSREVKMMDLQYDMGVGNFTGYFLLRKLEDDFKKGLNYWPKYEPLVAAPTDLDLRAMKNVIRRVGLYPRKVAYA